MQTQTGSLVLNLSRHCQLRGRQVAHPHLHPGAPNPPGKPGGAFSGVDRECLTTSLWRSPWLLVLRLGGHLNSPKKDKKEFPVVARELESLTITWRCWLHAIFGLAPFCASQVDHSCQKPIAMQEGLVIGHLKWHPSLKSGALIVGSPQGEME